MRSYSFLRTCLANAAALGLALAFLWVSPAALAAITFDNTPSGGTAGAANIELIRDTVVDAPSGQYVGLRVSSSIALTNVYARAIVGGVGYSLDVTEAQDHSLGDLAGTAKTSFWFINIPTTLANGTFTVQIYKNGPPGVGTLEATSSNYGLVSADVDQAAAANKINSVVINGGSPIVLGQDFNAVVCYDINSSNGTNIGISPAATSAFDPTGLQLLNVPSVQAFGTSGCTGTLISTNSNQLYYTGIGSGGLNAMRATYTFRAMNPLATALSPIVSSRSGQYKYNPDFSTFAGSTVPAPSNAVALAKSVSVAENAGAVTVTYTITATNTASVAVTLDSFIDTLPSSPATATYVAGSARFNGAVIANPTISGQQLTWDNPGGATAFSIPANSNRSLTFQANIPATNGIYTNNAIAKIGAVVIDTTLVTGDNVPATAVTRVGPPVLTVTKTADTPTVVNTAAGTTARYTLKVANTGTTAAGVKIADTALPTGFAYLSTVAVNTPTSGTCAAAAARTTTVNPAAGATAPSWGDFSIPGGCEVSVRFDASVANTVANGIYSNSASTTTTTTPATITNFDGFLAASTTDNVSVLSKPTISKSFNPSTAGVGSPSLMTLTITNANSTALSGLSVADTYPAGLLNTATPGGVTTCTGGSVTAAANGGSVALNGGTVSANSNCTVTAYVSAGVAGSYINTSGGVSSTETGVAGVASSAATLTVVGTQLSKAFGPSSMGASQTATLTFTLANGAGNPAQTNLGFTDTLPSGLTVSGTPTVSQCGGSVTSTANSVTLSGGSLALAAPTCTVTLNVIASTVGNYTNTTTNIGGLSGGLDAAGVAANLAVLARPTIVKSFLTNPIQSDIGTSALQIVLGNSNSVPLTGTTFTDTFPVTPGTMTLADVTTTNSCGGSLLNNLGATLTVGSAGIQLTGGTIPANGSCTITVNVKANLAGDYINTIAASPGQGFLSTAEGGGNTAPASASLGVRLAAPSVAKNFSPSTISAFTATTLTLTIINSSTVQAISGVTWSDIFPVGLKVFSVPNFTNTCGGTVTSGAAADDTSIAINSATVPFNAGGTGSCSISVSVTSTVVADAPGMTNTTDTVASTNANTSATASANLIVTAPPLTAPTIAKAFLQPSIGSGDISTIRFTLGSANMGILNDANFTDTLTNMSVASTAIGGTCAGVTNNPALVVGATGPNALNLTVPNLPPGGCTVEVQVTSTTLGVNPNSVSGVTTTLTLIAGAGAGPVNLTVVTKPTISKSFSPVTIANGGTSTITFNLGNGNASALANANFTDALNSMSVASTALGGTCAGVTNSPARVVGATGGGALNLTVPNLPAGGCTISVEVTSTTAGVLPNTAGGVTTTQTPTAGVASNTATLTVGAGGVSLYGTVYKDTNHNLQLDGGESGTGLTLYAKLISSSGGSALQAVLVSGVTGAYALSNVSAGSYTIVLDDNNVLGDITPSLPTGWIGVEMPDFRRTNVQVVNVNQQNLNFGLFNGGKVSGFVFGDIGVGAGIPNNGVKDGAEAGIAGVTVMLVDGTGAITYDSTVTAGDGSYTLWMPPATVSATLKIVEINLNGYLSTGGSIGGTGGSYDRASDSVTFTNVTGGIFSGINFGDTPSNRFVANGQQSGLSGNVVYYPHQFTAGSAGAATFSVASASGWPVVLYRDSNCNGQIDAGESVLGSPANLVAGEGVCIINRVNIPVGTALGLQDNATVQVSFSYVNAGPALVTNLLVTDTTTVGAGSAALALTKAVDKTTATPGTNISYTLRYQNNGSMPIGVIVISDATPAFTTFISATCGSLPTMIVGCTVVAAPAVGGVGPIHWQLTGTLSPASVGQVEFVVKLNN